MRLRCPSCGSVEAISDLRGAWWATCDQCGHTIKVIGSLKKEENKEMEIQCPECGYREADVAVPSSNILVSCPECGFQWRLNA